MLRERLQALAIGAALIGNATIGADTQTPERFKARLSTVPIDVPMMATVAGTGSVTAELSGAMLTISGTFDGLRSPATVARLHRAARSLRGPAVFDLTVEKSTSGSIKGSITLTSAQVGDLRGGRLYLQLHSEKAPEGNLWGWFFTEERRP